MKFKELINKMDPDVFAKRFSDLYPDYSVDEHIMILERLKYMSPDDEPSRMTIVVKKVQDEFSDTEEYYYDVSGHAIASEEEAKDDPWIKAGDEVNYALEFTKWSEWLTMNVSQQTLEEYPLEDIVVHCIWEMTFIGYDEDSIQEQIDDLNKTVEDIKSGKTKTYTMDEVMERLRNIIEEKDDD